MTDLTKPTRRSFLKIGGAALVALPALGLSTGAFAAKNDAVRAALAYQSAPKDGKSCSTCVNYQAANNGCTLMPGDTEIEATGYCSGYVAKS